MNIKQFLNRLNGWQRIGFILSISWMLFSIAVIFITKPSLIPNGSTSYFMCGESMSAFWDCKPVSTKQSAPPLSTQHSAIFDDVPMVNPPTNSGVFDDLIPKVNKPHGANRHELVNERWFLNWEIFLIFVFLPILALWIIPYTAKALIKWVIDGFKKSD